MQYSQNACVFGGTRRHCFDSLMSDLILSATFAINAAIYAIFAVGELEYVRKFLLGRRDATGILAFHDVNDLYGQLGVVLAHVDAVFDQVDCEIMIDISEYREIGNDLRVYFYDILFAHSATLSVFDDSDRAIKFVKA